MASFVGITVAMLGACGGASRQAAVPVVDSSLSASGDPDPIAGLGPLEDAAAGAQVLSVQHGRAADVSLVARAFASQVYYADTRRRMGEWEDAVHALQGAMALVRTGEAERLTLKPATRTSLAAFADDFARAGREGEALGCYLWLSRPGDSRASSSAQEHERALESWMLGGIEDHPSSWRNAMARARVHAYYPSVATRDEAESALGNWISVLREAGSRLGRGSAADLKDLQTGMRDVGVELAALYLRDGDARGAADALERADKTSGPAVAKSLRIYADAPSDKTVGPVLALMAPQENQERVLYAHVAPLTSLVRLFVSLNGRTSQPVLGATLSALDVLRLSYVAPALPHGAAPRPDARAAAALLLQEVATRELGAEDVPRTERALRDADAFLHEGSPDIEDNGALRMLTFLRGSAKSLEGDFQTAEEQLRALLPIPPKEPGRLEYANALEGLARDEDARSFLTRNAPKPDSKEAFFHRLILLRLESALSPQARSLPQAKLAWQALCAPRKKDDAAQVRALRCAAIDAALHFSVSKMSAPEAQSALTGADPRVLAHELAAVDLFTGKPDGLALVRAALEQGVSANELVYPALWTLSAMPLGHPDRAWLSKHIFAVAEQDPRWRGRVATYARTGDVAGLRAAAHGKLEIGETDFYEGLAKHRAGDAAGANEAWTRVRKARPIGLQEYEFAHWFSLSSP